MGVRDVSLCNLVEEEPTELSDFRAAFTSIVTQRAAYHET